MFCPVRFQIAQTVVHFSHFGVQGQRAAHQAVTAPMHTATACRLCLKIAIYCCVTVQFHLRSARYNCRHMVPVPMHTVKSLHTTNFPFGLKIATMCFMWDHWQPDASALTWTWLWQYTVTVRLILGAGCLQGLLYIPSLPQHKSCLCSFL